MAERWQAAGYPVAVAYIVVKAVVSIMLWESGRYRLRAATIAVARAAAGGGRRLPAGRRCPNRRTRLRPRGSSHRLALVAQPACCLGHGCHLMAFCAGGGRLVTRLAVVSFTLGLDALGREGPLEEDWLVQHSALVLTQARIQGSGAGMDPPEGAVLADGFWHFRPQLGPCRRLSFARRRRGRLAAVSGRQLPRAGSLSAGAGGPTERGHAPLPLKVTRLPG